MHRPVARALPLTEMANRESASVVDAIAPFYNRAVEQNTTALPQWGSRAKRPGARRRKTHPLSSATVHTQSHTHTHTIAGRQKKTDLGI